MGWGEAVKWSRGAAACAVLLSGPAFADQGQARFRVSATVPVRVVLETVAQPDVLTVTADDIARGFVDVSARYRVRLNDRDGYLLQIAPLSADFREIRVGGLGGPVVLQQDAVEVFRPGDGFAQELTLDFRVVLDDAARPGTFDLPVQVAALPL